MNPTGSDDDDRSELSHPNARLGIVLFLIYLLLYAAFIGLNTFAPGAMARPVFAGINLAIVCGFGLILAALVLALVYMALCKSGGDEEGGA